MLVQHSVFCHEIEARDGARADLHALYLQPIPYVHLYLVVPRREVVEPILAAGTSHGRDVHVGWAIAPNHHASTNCCTAGWHRDAAGDRARRAAIAGVRSSHGSIVPVLPRLDVVEHSRRNANG